MRLTNIVVSPAFQDQVRDSLGRVVGVWPTYWRCHGVHTIAVFHSRFSEKDRWVTGDGMTQMDTTFGGARRKAKPAGRRASQRKVSSTFVRVAANFEG